MSRLYMENVSVNSREDAARILLDIIRPLKGQYSPGHAWLQAGSSGSAYCTRTAWMEGFARILWGLGPLWGGGTEKLSEAVQKEAGEWQALYLDGILHGTDPEHPEYWGDLKDYDQMMVEMAALAVTISLSPDKFWEPLGEGEKNNLYSWLNQINQKKVHPNNWKFFRILVNMTFRLLGKPWSKEAMKEDMELIESCYLGDGWYSDGKKEQIDYYIPFAMHFYGLVYAERMKEKDPETAERLRERGSEFAKDFIYWFGADGNEIPFGRSLTYRFAHGAFFSAAAFAGIEGTDYGVLKELALNNLKVWLERPIFDNGGVLTIGYGYQNPAMCEMYNAQGSPYWSLKTFLMLALPEEHPFWQAERKAPVYEAKRLLPHPHMLITHDEANHVLAYVAGQHCMYDHGSCREKYEKFVYSNQFGFSVSRGTTLSTGAFDNTLAVSLAGDDTYRMRKDCESFEVTEEQVKVSCQMMPGVHVTSTIIPCGPWHVRIHEIQTEAAIDVADGGFALPVESESGRVDRPAPAEYTKDMVTEQGDRAAADFPWGVSAVLSLTGGECRVVPAFINTNLFAGRTVIPTVTKRLEPGTHRMVTCVLGDRSEKAGEYLAHPPKVEMDEDGVRVAI
ncbi:MAG: DUF2264 domain-containing protein [Lachnospiraceae bacterium]|nr:DUF2264 domain-containing protein [Lachnospiraceae bacterium]